MRTRLRAAVSRLGFALARRRVDDDTRREIDAHLDLLVERYSRQGMSPDDAHRAARQQFGSAALVREDIHDMNSMGWVEQGLQDLRYAFRQLRSNPTFAGVAIATLGLGIGGVTAVFSVVQAVLLAPLPYEEPGQLLRFYQQEPDNPGTKDVLAGTHFTFLREHATAFEEVAAIANYRETGVDLFIDGRAERVQVLRVSSGYFSVLRSPPRLGRAFDREDETGAPRVVLSDALWQVHFGGDPGIVGRTIRMNGRPIEVAGIAAPGFDDPIAPDVAAWIPYALARDTDAENNSLTVIGRLRNGVTLEQARAELTTLATPMRERWPAASKSAIVATPLHEDLVTSAREPLRLVFAAVELVLLAACVNVANLALVRATGRVHEFAVRAALGSGRRRLVRQLLVESLVLASLGSVLGLALAAGGIRMLRATGRQALPRLDDVALNADVLLFAVATTLVTAVAFGIAPALRLAATSPVQGLRQQSRSTTGGRGIARLHSALAATQIALALTLLAGAGVLLASFQKLQRVDTGFRVDDVLTFEVNLPTVRYDDARRAAFQEELAHQLETIPGVTAAGGISRLPATGSYHPWNTRILTGPRTGALVDGSRFAMQQRVVSGDVFAALGIRVLAGRTFDARDDAGALATAVVSANFARAAFPERPLDAVPGQRISAGGRPALAIIGVVADVALDPYGAPTMVVYHAHRQFAGDRNWTLSQVIAADRSAEQMLGAVREVVARLDPELVVYRPAAMADVIGRGTSRERFALVLMGAFAVVALALAALGLYGVLAYSVRQRASEIGIRVALGATAMHVRALVLRQAAVVVTLGVAAGLAGALVLGRWLDALAFGITASDPRVLAASAGVLALVALIAAGVPAQRATRVEPRVAMQDSQ
ncbi:MAG: ABC transporter permease [Acidobacteria bacterium]|nr:ABC transporter permease [Acidobacteriota bacterium]